MRVFAISDLHLALAADKPMDIFGPGWEGYMQRLRQNWNLIVTDEDLVLIPGDLSWATYLDMAGPDFHFIEELPGRKIISKGNHDYWWATHKKLNMFLERETLSSISFLQNNIFFYDNFAVAGSRGWKNPEDDGFTNDDEKIYDRELERLKLSLKHAEGFQGIIICMLHYPPFNAKGSPGEFIELMKSYGVSVCVYGHLHGKRCALAVEGEYDGIRYHLVSSDYLNFVPLFLGEW